ncbi:hypothetical protein NQ318_007441 [Aromia moschata]|uniref:Uncharacterized protein n=1 Tax=Aromia moschata TaxID=1265417 RepID=A0AAV8YM56_9CUCU|nr:hypothetical protein NQ318_007441 [Aromia moschata]
MLKSYTALRRQREEFRQRLVNLIINKDDDQPIDIDEIPSAKKGKCYVLALVPRRLMVWEETLAKSLEDVREDFMSAMKKSIIDFVLQDPSFVKSLSEGESASRKELKEIGNSFRPCFDTGKLKMERNLNVINPCLSVLLDLWYTKYR